MANPADMEALEEWRILRPDLDDWQIEQEMADAQHEWLEELRVRDDYRERYAPQATPSSREKAA